MQKRTACARDKRFRALRRGGLSAWLERVGDDFTTDARKVLLSQCAGWDLCLTARRLRGPKADIKNIDDHRWSPPLDELQLIADALGRVLDSQGHDRIRDVLGDVDALEEAVDRLERYEPFQWRILKATHPRRHFHPGGGLPIQSIPMILRLHLGRWCAVVADVLVASGESSTERLFKACAPYARQIKRSSEIIGVLCRALGGHPGQRLMTPCVHRRENRRC